MVAKPADGRHVAQGRAPGGPVAPGWSACCSGGPDAAHECPPSELGVSLTRGRGAAGCVVEGCESFERHRGDWIPERRGGFGYAEA